MDAILMKVKKLGIVHADHDRLEPLLATAAIALEARLPGKETPQLQVQAAAPLGSLVKATITEAPTTKPPAISQAGVAATTNGSATSTAPGSQAEPATGAAPVEPYPVTTTLLTDPTVVLLLVVLSFPLVLIAVLALRPESGMRTWLATSFWDFRGLFSGIGNRRQKIHDQPYLDRVLKAEREQEESLRRRGRSSKRGRGPGPVPSNPSRAANNDPPQA